MPNEQENTNSQESEDIRRPSSSDNETVLISRDESGQILPGEPISAAARQLYIPGCRLLSVLGSGGMGTVYLARQENLQRLVAIKVLNANYAENPRFLKRLSHEALTLGALSHPNVVSCHDVITTDDGIFIIMEYIPGRLSGRDLVLRLGPVPEHLVAEILVQVVRGLAYVQSKGFIHRDLKPDNLLLYRESNSPPHTFADIFGRPDWRVTICDFGIAAGGTTPEDEEPGHVIGSPAFMAPEQAFCVEKVDFRSDIYALGATAYFLLTGVAPFDGHSRDERLLLKAENNIPDPKLPNGQKLSRQFLRILRRMGAVDQEERYQDYASLLADLESLQFSYDAKRKGGLQSFAGRQGSFLLGFGLGGVILLLALSGVLFHRWMLRLEAENSIPKTISLIFWEGARDQWRIFQRDVNCDGPTLVGNHGAGELTLREVLQPGQSVQVEVRLLGIGGASLQIVDEEGVRVNFLCHHLNDPGIQLWRMEVDGQTTPLGQIQLNNSVQWTKVTIQVHKQQIWFHVNGELRGVRHLEKGIEEWRLRLGTVKGVYFQLKDLQVLGERE